MATIDDINRLTRDHNRYTGDGLPGEPVNAPLPVGDPRSGQFNLPKAAFREIMIGILQAEGDPEALQQIKNDLAGKATTEQLSDLSIRDAKIFNGRQDAVNKITENPLPAQITRIMALEDGVQVFRAPTAFADDPLFGEGNANGRWGVVLRVDLPAEAKARADLSLEVAKKAAQTDLEAAEAAREALAVEVGKKATQTALQELSGVVDESATALAAETAERSAMLQPNDGAFLVLDPESNVIARITPQQFSLMGRMTFAEFDGADFILRDDTGFVMLRVSPDGIRHMGRDITGPSTEALTAAAPDVELARTAIRKPKVRSLPKWRYARAGVVQGLRSGRIACLGDSNTMGWGATGATAHRRALSYPSALAKRLADLNATAANYFGRALSANSGYTTYDPRITLNGWSTTGPLSLGGEMWFNDSTTDALVFTPDEAWNVADVWVAVDAAATLTLGIAGNEVSQTPATGQIVKLTFTAPTVAVQALRMARVSGAVRIIGWSCRNSLRAGVEVLNMGRASWRSDQYADASAYYSPRNAIAVAGADLHLIQLGLNDWNQSRNPSLFATDMQALITATAAVGDAALIVPRTPNGSKTYAWSEFVTVMRDLASGNAIPLIDLGTRLGDAAEATAAGWMTDDLHPNAYGYGETAVAVHHLLTL